MSNLYRQCLQSPSVLLLIVITAACSGGGGSSGAGSTPPSIETETIHGTLSVDPEYAVQSDDLMVVTPAEATSLQPDGLFTAETTTVSSHQVIVLCDKESRRPVYLGLRGPGETGVEMSLSSTATALLLFHPYLAFATAAQRDAYLVQATAHPGFATLLSLLDGAYRSDGALALDFEAHPLIYQALVLLMTDVLSGMEADFSQSQAFGLPSGPPWIEDAPGAGVNLVNPHFCWYAVQVQEAAGAVVGTFPVARVEKLVELSWTGFTKAEPVQTQLSLGDGSFELFVTKAFDFHSLGDVHDPVGLATTYNTATGIIYLLELVIGDVLPSVSLIDLPSHLTISANDAAQMALSMQQGDTIGFLQHVLEVISSNADEIALWLWFELAGDGPVTYLSSIAGLLQNVTLAVKLLGLANGPAPFFYDLLFAPSQVTYQVVQTNGVVALLEENAAPTASFEVSPPAGTVETPFVFDASSSSDDHDLLSMLTFAWDWNADGVWDTPWSTDPLTSWTFELPASHSVIVGVRDTSGLIGLATRSVTVGGAEGTATHVKLFRDVHPWDTDSTVDVLQLMGFMPGFGPQHYEVLTSEDMATAPLIPGTDLVIISNDQTQSFYDAYAASQIRFVDFVHDGGSLLWGACDQVLLTFSGDVLT